MKIYIIKRKDNTKYEKIISIAIVVVVVIVVGVVFIPRLAHTCDDCGKFFIGTGYEANIVSDLFSKDEQIICKDCAEKQHAVTTVEYKINGSDYKKTAEFKCVYYMEKWYVSKFDLK